MFPRRASADDSFTEVERFCSRADRMGTSILSQVMKREGGTGGLLVSVRVSYIDCRQRANGVCSEIESAAASGGGVAGGAGGGAGEHGGRVAGAVSDAGAAGEECAEGCACEAGRGGDGGVWVRGGEDLLGQLLELNLRVAAMEKQGKALTGPGVPKSYP